jgi:hypothetical protein
MDNMYIYIYIQYSIYIYIFNIYIIILKHLSFVYTDYIQIIITNHWYKIVSTNHNGFIEFTIIILCFVFR